MLAPTFAFVGIITAIGYLQLFAEPYVMTPDGGPLQSTISVVMLMYKEGFRWWNMGYAAAVAFILFVVIAVASVTQLWLQRERAIKPRTAAAPPLVPRVTATPPGGSR
jgi:multiple sugar transport system permease protein